VSRISYIPESFGADIDNVTGEVCVGCSVAFRNVGRKWVRTPMEVRVDVDDSSELAMNVPYRETIGSLMSLMVGTRPDIAFAVSRMAKYVESPTILQWKAVKHIMRYIRHTSDYGLEFGGSGNVDFKCFCDSDWVGDKAARKSTSGYIFCMAGGAISWS
jgi:hypothetical protein